jgi:hypothetical protein
MQGPGLTNIADSPTSQQHQSHHIRIKIPSISGMNLRRSSRHASSAASGSEYHASEKSVDMDQQPEDALEQEKPAVQYSQTRSGRKVMKKIYHESSEGEMESAANLFSPANDRRVSRAPSKRLRQYSVEDEDEGPPRRMTRRTTTNHLGGFIAPDEEEEDDGEQPYGLRPRKGAIKANGPSIYTSNKKQSKPQPRLQNSRITRRSAQVTQDTEEDFRPPTSSPATADAEGSIDEAPGSSDLDIQHEPEPQPEPEEEELDDGRPYALRQRQPVNYVIPPPLEDLPAPPRKISGKNTRSGHSGISKKRGLGWSANGAELGRWMGMPADDSVNTHVSIYFRSVILIFFCLGLGLPNANPSEAIWWFRPFRSGSSCRRGDASWRACSWYAVEPRQDW